MDFNECVKQGHEFFQEKDYESALGKFNEALEFNKDNPQILKMISCVKGIIREESQKSQALENEIRSRAEVMGIKVEEVDKVIETLERNQKDDSIKSYLCGAYYIQGLKFSFKKEHAQAIESYKNAITNGDNPYAYNKLGQTYSDTGDFDKAIDIFKELKGRHPDFNMIDSKIANAYCSRGMAYFDKEKYDLASDDFKTALDFKSDDSTMRELLEMAEAKKAKH